MHYQTDEAYNLLHEGILALARAEQQGMRVDTKYIHKKQRKITQEIAKNEKDFMKTKFYKKWDKSTSKKVNIYSSDQLSKYLYDTLKIKIKKQTSSGGGSTDEEALQQLNIPELDIVLRNKKLKKMRDTYLEGFLREEADGYIHPFFNLHLVKTFRGSSDSPNFQNIPKRDEEAMNVVRRALFPRPGHQLLELDYSQLEVRIAACYHQDPMMLKYINDPTTDMHRDMAQELFKIKKFNSDDKTHKVIRAATKNGFVFPQFYGDYYVNCAKNLTVGWGQLPEKGKWKPGQGIAFEKGHLSDHMIKQGFPNLKTYMDHVQKIEKDFWNKRFPVYNKWKKQWYYDYQKNGFITSKTGFTFQGAMSRNDVINYPVQGAAFHVLLWSLIQATNSFLRDRFDTRIIGQIHDAIVLDVNPKELHQVIPIMKCIMCNDVVQHWDWINVPLQIEAELCEVDQPWSTKKDYEIN